MVKQTQIVVLNGIRTHNSLRRIKRRAVYLTAYMQSNIIILPDILYLVIFLFPKSTATWLFYKLTFIVYRNAGL